MSFWKKKINSDEYLELKTELAALKIDFKSMQLDLNLILKKLKFKYKITARDLKEEEGQSEDIKSSVLLPENGIL